MMFKEAKLVHVLLAQWLERWSYEPQVVGSNPTGDKTHEDANFKPLLHTSGTSACSVAASYKPPKLVIRVRLPAGTH